MTTNEEVLLKNLLISNSIVLPTRTIYDFEGKTTPTSEIIVKIIMSHPAKENIISLFCGTYAMITEFGKACRHRHRDSVVKEFIRYNPLALPNQQIEFTHVKNVTGWYATEDDFIRTVKFDSYTPKPVPTTGCQYFGVGFYKGQNDSCSIENWKDNCEDGKELPDWYNADEEYVQNLGIKAAADLEAFIASMS